MKIGEFVTLMNTTKDTVRYYEELKLLNPKWQKNNKDYGEKDILHFQVVQELKGFGLTLREIQLIFNIKDDSKCGDKQLIAQVCRNLTEQLDRLRQEEEEIYRRRKNLEHQVEELKQLL